MKNLIFVAFLAVAGCTTIQDSNIRTVYQNPQFVSTPAYPVYTPPVTSVIASPVYYNNWGLGGGWGGWGWGGWGWGRGWGGCW